MIVGGALWLQGLVESDGWTHPESGNLIVGGSSDFRGAAGIDGWTPPESGNLIVGGPLISGAGGI